MQISKGDSLINRTQFNSERMFRDAIWLLTGKNKINSNNIKLEKKKRFDNYLIDTNPLNIPSESGFSKQSKKDLDMGSKITEKPSSSTSLARVTMENMESNFILSKSNSSKQESFQNEQLKFPYKTKLKEAHNKRTFLPTNYSGFFAKNLLQSSALLMNGLARPFFNKTALANLRVRPTPINILFSITVFSIALLNTLQKRELLSSKLPGYTLTQKSSWETFEKFNSTITNKLLPVGQKERKGRTGANIAELSKTKEKDLTKLSQENNWYTQNNSTRTNEAAPSIKFVDLYKDKALIYLCSPWEKQTRKDFVGFFAGRSLANSSNLPLEMDLKRPNLLLDSESERDGLLIDLPWYRIDACNPVLVEPYGPSKTSQMEAKSNVGSLPYAKPTLASGADLPIQPYDRSKPSKASLAKTRLIASTTKSSLPSASVQTGLAREDAQSLYPFTMNLESNNLTRNKIAGLEYLFSFQTSRERVYAENDTIPRKLESGYLFKKGANRDPNFIDKGSLAKISKELLTKNSKMFFGKQFYQLQEELRNLFYSYGLTPPRNLRELLDKLEFQVNSNKDKEQQKLNSLQSDSQGEDIDVEKETTDVDDLTAQESRVGAALPDGHAQLFLVCKEIENLISPDCLEQEPVTSPSSTLSYSEVKKLNNVDHAAVTGAELSDAPVRVLLKRVLNWPLIANTSSLAPESDAPLNSFEKNNVIWTRFMSDYKFPDSSKEETSCLFRKYVLPRLLISYSASFSCSYLINQVVSRPLYIKLPPVLPSGFFKNVLFGQHPPLFLTRPKLCTSSTSQTRPTYRCVDTLAATSPINDNSPGTDNSPGDVTDIVNSSFEIPKECKPKIEYKRISLQELKDIRELFGQLGRDYQDYLNLPKDSPSALRISSSLEDDKSLKLEEQREKRDDEKATAFERLQKIRRREQKLEQGKELRAFAYKNKLASSNLLPYEQTLLGDASKRSLLAPRSCVATIVDTLPREQTFIKDKKGGIVERADLSASFQNREANFWIPFKLGSQNLLSDRKYSFFGQKHLLTKRLIAKEQKEINENIIKASYCAPNRREQILESNFRPEGSRAAALSTNKELRSLTSYKRLQRKARKGSIKLIGSPKFSTHVGTGNRTRKPNRALRGKVLSSAYSHLRWQKKRFRSRMLGTPCKRHLIMPAITSKDWKKILEWQLKNYFFLEDKRLQVLIRDNPEKSFKIKQLHLYLPWVTIRTTSNKRFQWPSTRLDYEATGPALMGWERIQKPSRALSSKQALLARLAAIRLRWLGLANSADLASFPKTWQMSNGSASKTSRSECTLLAPRLPIYAKPVYKDERFRHNESRIRYHFGAGFSTYKPVHYWDSGKWVSLSLNTPECSNLVQSSSRSENTLLALASGASFGTRSKQARAGIRARTTNQPYLCEPLTNQSWLLLYRLFLAFALKHILKYIYRVSLKDFILKMANSDFGLMMTSPEFREWLENAPQKSFYTPQKRFEDIAAIEESIPTYSDIIWYLRNSGRGRAASRGLLLVGPAGAEKTSVVQAIAGECRLPVIVQSLSALALTYEEPYERLENVFNLARQQAPCVLFLDDLDTIGQSRAHVIRNDVGAEDLLFSLDTYTREGKLCLANQSDSLQTYLLPLMPNKVLAGNQPFASFISRSTVGGKQASLARGDRGDMSNSWQFNSLAANPVDQPNVEFAREQKQEGNFGKDNDPSLASPVNDVPGSGRMGQEFQARRLNLLLRLLTLMDGIAPLNGVVIVATSEQPALLDPALLRAGRFERKIHMSLPNQERRIQLFKLETKKIGRMQIPWDYLGTRTANMSGADIASAINHSAIRAILDNTVHTVETLEHGLNCVTGLRNKDWTQHSSKLPLISLCKGNDPFHYSRLAFYQAGKAVVHNLLPDHPKLGFCSYNTNVTNPDLVTDSCITGESLQVLVPNHASIKPSRDSARRDSNGFGFTPEPYGIGSAEGDGLPTLRRQSNDGHTRFSTRDVSTNLESAVIKRGHSTKGQALLKRRALLRSSQAAFLSARDSSSYWSQLTNRSKARESAIAVSARTRAQFSTRLVGLYAGKAAELLHHSSNIVSDSLALASKARLTRHSGAMLRPLDPAQPKFATSSHEKNKTSGWLWQSNLGFSELFTASSLIHSMVDRWYLYSQKIFTCKINKLIPSLNHEQIRDETLFPLAKKFSQELEFDSIRPAFWGISSNTDSALTKSGEAGHSWPTRPKMGQERIRAHWWQAKICQALEMGERPYGKWYRIYLPKLEEREHNEEWVPPDLILHQSLTLANLATKRINSYSSDDLRHSVAPSQASLGLAKVCSLTSQASPKTALKETESNVGSLPYAKPNGKSASKSDKAGFAKTRLARKRSAMPRSFDFIKLRLNADSSMVLSPYKTFNDLYLFERDHAYQTLVMNSFYAAFRLLNENRELLDLFADHLIRFKILRSYEISRICSLFS